MRGPSAPRHLGTGRETDGRVDDGITMTLAGGEIGERHLVSSADFSVHLMNLARESVRWKPLGHRVCVQERPINSLRRRAEHSVKSNGVGVVCCHIRFVFSFFIIMTNGVRASGHLSKNSPRRFTCALDSAMLYSEP